MLVGEYLANPVSEFPFVIPQLYGAATPKRFEMVLPVITQTI